MRRVGRGFAIARVDDGVTLGLGEQRAHIGIEDGVLDEVINDVEGKRQIERAEIVWKSVCQIKTFSRVMRKARGTPFDRESRHIDADIFGIPGQFKLSAVAATEFYDGANVLRPEQTRSRSPP